ncbi:EF hand [Mariniblastus fucicola]|uniref:EF hand n=2 Tax=Mariniblastus fucicola TaxID=980251 RepID=A0A5B9PFH0_9BACT|nr:EF hand [Mariniblastus fucicola]
MPRSEPFHIASSSAALPHGIPQRKRQDRDAVCVSRFDVNGSTLCAIPGHLVDRLFKLAFPVMVLLVVFLISSKFASAHEGHSHTPSVRMQEKIVELNTQSSSLRFAAFQRKESTAQPELAKLFEPFAEKVDVRFDRDNLYVESNGMPDHPMMVGITAWQQQVPLPQNYTGENAWRIPLNPVPAKNPMSAKSHFFRGAIALAANGVPIFNPIKNDGKTDTLLAGELDQWGGHCGRADDYHYHIAPVHLEKIVGEGNPVAVALDGYPIYGYNDPNGKPPTNLDWLNGHEGPDGNYHYHATKTYPYLNGGFYGEVTEREGQVDPQPRTAGVRPALRGLRGARINGYENPEPGRHIVRYEVNGEEHSIDYTVEENGSATFKFISPNSTTTETYEPRQRENRRGERNSDRGANSPANEPRGERGPRRNGRGNEGDSLVRALDSDRSGAIEADEIEKAALALQSMDRNGDGEISREELRGDDERGERRSRQRGDGQGSQRDRGRANGSRGPRPDDGPRQPWILVHAGEIDLNADNVIARDEIVGEATKAFASFDVNNDGQLNTEELGIRGGSKSAMAGFLKGHSKEIDRDGNGVLSKAEVINNAERMFNKMDRDSDDQISASEMEAAKRR